MNRPPAYLYFKGPLIPKTFCKVAPNEPIQFGDYVLSGNTWRLLSYLLVGSTPAGLNLNTVIRSF